MIQINLIPEKDHPVWDFVREHGPKAWRAGSIIAILLLTASKPDKTEVQAWLFYLLLGEGPTAFMNGSSRKS